MCTGVVMQCLAYTWPAGGGRGQGTDYDSSAAWYSQYFYSINNHIIYSLFL